jgi:hypothetical protein
MPNKVYCGGGTTATPKNACHNGYKRTRHLKKIWEKIGKSWKGQLTFRKENVQTAEGLLKSCFHRFSFSAKKPLSCLLPR